MQGSGKAIRFLVLKRKGSFYQSANDSKGQCFFGKSFWGSKDQESGTLVDTSGLRLVQNCDARQWESKKHPLLP